MSLWGAVMGHANLILHGAGWMEGGLVASFEKLIVDVELIQSMGEGDSTVSVFESRRHPWLAMTAEMEHYD